MRKQLNNFKNLNYLIISFCFFSFSTMYSQIDFSKKNNDVIYKGSTISKQKQGDYLEETKALGDINDTITFLYDKTNIAKRISIKNKKGGITNDQFHKYAEQIIPKFRFHSKLQNGNSTTYFNEEKDLVYIQTFEDTTRNKLIELVFISGQQMIEKTLPNLKK